jgi:hypothetical protein
VIDRYWSDDGDKWGSPIVGRGPISSDDSAILVAGWDRGSGPSDAGQPTTWVAVGEEHR